MFRYPEDIRKAIYMTNAAESLNSVIRKAIKKRKLFPSDNSAKKVVYLAVMDASKKWTMLTQPVYPGRGVLWRPRPRVPGRQSGRLQAIAIPRDLSKNCLGGDSRPRIFCRPAGNGGGGRNGAFPGNNAPPAGRPLGPAILRSVSPSFRRTIRRPAVEQFRIQPQDIKIPEQNPVQYDLLARKEAVETLTRLVGANQGPFLHLSKEMLRLIRKENISFMSAHRYLELFSTG